MTGFKPAAQRQVNRACYHYNVLSPIDLIPDVIPVVGLVDDAAVIAICLLMIEQELHDYSEWKAANS